ncbi:hypothetical protein CsSME_00031189 [Camellia sinensis var. sinensis]
MPWRNTFLTYQALHPYLQHRSTALPFDSAPPPPINMYITAGPLCTVASIATPDSLASSLTIIANRSATTSPIIAKKQPNQPPKKETIMGKK